MRALIVIAVMAIVGVSALAWMARRYASIVPQPTGEGLGGAAAAAGPGAALQEVDAFVAVRRPLKAMVSEDPRGFRQLAGQAAGNPSAGGALNENFVLMTNFRMRRQAQLEATGLKLERYAALRAAYRDWKAGRALADAGLAAAFELRRSVLAEVELGDGEALDDAMQR
jgi:hypothetical protein